PVLPTVNALLNLLALGLLLAGRLAIRRGDRPSHARLMRGAFMTSCLFLACYLWHHARVGSVRFDGEGPIRTVYLGILLTHTVLAALVPPLALRVLWLAGHDRRAEHKRLALWTWPIWVYVSFTGVVIYSMLYLRPLVAPAAASLRGSV
ncbi:MAG: DUF420 domain-containing protein, partial [Planctomycetaceae bacterium]|nr:DUF420 domain-containing protein [Planctomycetaceae bacterium]